jgi:hypothetical protein
MPAGAGGSATRPTAKCLGKATLMAGFIFVMLLDALV